MKEIEGFLTTDEGVLLYQLAKNCTGKGVIVEIGSFKGKSTVYLALGSKYGNNVKVYAIDPHTGKGEYSSVFGETLTFKEFSQNIENARVEDVVIPMVMTSEQAAKKFGHKVELIFIDGGHDWISVWQDFNMWYPMIVEHGIIAFHDTVGWPGPKRIAKCLAHSTVFRKSGIVDSIWYAEKVSRNSVLDQIRNDYILFIKDIYEFAYKKFSLPRWAKRLGKKILRLAQ
jgi:predicted O-methyltransferase YrrM